MIRFVQLMLRFGLPLVFAAAIGLCIYDRLSPWELAEDMVSNRPNQTRLLVGAGYSSRSTYATPGSLTERSAEYVFFPEVLKTRESYLLSRRDDREATVTINPFSPAAYILGVVIAIALLVAAWCLPLVKKKTGAYVA